jgi:RND family efflux transporter MFP subunit
MKSEQMRVIWLKSLQNTGPFEPPRGQRSVQRRSKRIFLILGILAVPAAATTLMILNRPEPPKRDVEDYTLLVDVIELQQGAEQFRVRSQGTVRPRTQTTLSAEVSGAIISISPKFIPGGVFDRDEVLMRIDPTNYAVAVDQAEALVKQRQIEFDGAAKLRTQGYRAESEYASAAAALASARAELVRAGRNLERTYIRLPYEGMVWSKDADIGQFVNPGTPLGVTFAVDVAEVRLPLTDQDLAFVDLPAAQDIIGTGAGQGPTVVLAAVQKGRAQEWQAQIVRSEGVVDERSRVTYAVAEIRDPYKLHGGGTPLPVGTFVSANIEGALVPDIIRVPRSALRGSDQVLVVDDGDRIRLRSVNVVRADSAYAYVRGGVAPGERISVTAIENPTNGMLVRVEGAAAQDTSTERGQVASMAEEE